MALFVGVLAAMAVPAPASAHAYLASSAPADGTVLDRAPEVLVLSFTEHVELASTKVDIVDGDGRHWAVTGLVVRPSGGATNAAGNESPVEIVAALPRLPANTYHVAWSTLSSDDLHATTGTIVFGMQREVSAAGAIPGPGGPGIRESALRGIGLVGLATLFGAAALVLLAAVGGGTISPRDRLLRVGLLGGGVALVATPVQLLVQVSADPGHWRALFVNQALSGRWLMRELGTAAVVAAMLWVVRARRPGRGKPIIVLGALGAIAAAAGTALLGHPSGATASGASVASTLPAAIVGAVHVLAAGAWAGGVLAAALALAPDLRLPDRAERVRSLLRLYGVLAVGCVTILAVTGLLLTGEQVSTVDGLLTTPYGLILLAKVATAGLAGLLGLRTAMRLRRPGVIRHGRRIIVEATALGVVLLLAGALASAGPARGPAFPVAGPVAVTPGVTGQVADLVDTVSIRPNRPGRNVVTIVVNDTRRPAPAPFTGVSVSFSGPDGSRKMYPVVRGADGWTLTVDDIRTAGNWQVAVTVMRDGLSPVTDVHDWAVPQASDPSRVVVSTKPLQPALNILAGLGAAAAVIVAIVFVLRRRRAAAAQRHPATTEDAPTEDAPTEDAPTEGAPTEATPATAPGAEDARTEDARTDEARTDEAPVEAAVREEATI